MRLFVSQSKTSTSMMMLMFADALLLEPLVASDNHLKEAAAKHQPNKQKQRNENKQLYTK